MPETAWHDLQPSEYGFFSNVNPNVDHPRWSQKTERRIAGKASKLFADRIATRMYNGYGEQVASMYAGLDLKKRSEEHTSELQSLMRISYAVFCLKKKKIKTQTYNHKQKNNIKH